ncbi:hypothetical protein RMATCC62417_00788 [Rhizopus microsporus]|nr:hypothetical protein RMATCC62417_00788 [Rhizopus microsporus]
MDMQEKMSNKSLTSAYDKEEIGRYDDYEQDDVPMSAEEKALVRKIDLYILPIICMIDFFQYVDKATIQYSASLNIKQDLSLSPTQYNVISSIFYLGFLVYQFPNNFLLQKLPIGRYIGVIIFLWGAVIACTTAATNFAQVTALRFLLGCFEAGIYPALTLLVSTFYRKSEQAVRLGLFWIFNGVATVVGGLISYGIQVMPNDHGIAKWKWLMLILGCCTVLLSAVTFFFLIDNPKSPALQLNPEQEILVEERIRDNGVVRTSAIKKEQMFEALKEFRFWAFMVSCLFITIQNGAMVSYIPLIAMDFGFTGIQSIFITLGSGLSFIVWIGLAVFLSKKTKQLFYIIALCMCIDILGLILLVALPDVRTKLIGVYLSNGFGGAYVLMMTALSNNVSGYTKKIFYNGVFMVFYTIGNFVGPFLMVDSTKPVYLPAMLTYIICNCIVILLMLLVRAQMAKVNRERISNPSSTVTNVEDNLTDVQDPNFIYRL